MMCGRVEDRASVPIRSRLSPRKTRAAEAVVAALEAAVVRPTLLQLDAVEPPVVPTLRQQVVVGSLAVVAERPAVAAAPAGVAEVQPTAGTGMRRFS